MDIDVLDRDVARADRELVARLQAKRTSKVGAGGKLHLLPIILDGIRVGMSVQSACLAAHVTQTTLYEWMKIHPEIAETFESARAEGERRLVAQVLQHAPKDFRAPLAILERRWSREYAPRYTIDSQSVTVNIEARLAELGVDTDTLSPEARERVIASVTRQLAPPKTT